jgi:hypothetical protein
MPMKILSVNFSFGGVSEPGIICIEICSIQT